ncbi:MAG: M48 family metalloprotease [Planctomycetes bacterium]|nr:M48 family metalloprotease [Planctomycetota bacterium]
MLKKTLLLLVLFGILLPSGCATNVVTGKKELMLISPAQELQIGTQYAPEVEKQMEGRIANRAIQNYVSRVGQSIAAVSHMPDLDFQYIAVNHESVNAMALPGGYIFITRGMLENLTTEAQLASILAHETIHVTARHSAAAISQQIGIDMVLSAVTNEKTSAGVANIAQMGTQLIGLKYSRAHEHEADTFGLDYMVMAGYDPAGMVEMMEILQQQSDRRPIEFFSTHPNPANRKESIVERMAANVYPQNLKTGRKDYKKYVLDNL